jgi:thiol-disulfide isomerase/thioredoxin
MRLLMPLLPLFLSLCAAAEPARLDGNTLEGRPFSLEALRGKVVMLFLWNTDCAPCLQKMPELRANAAGWRGRPFELVLISADRDRAAALSYLQTLKQVDRSGTPLAMLWLGDLRSGGGLASLSAGVPLTLVIDSEGHVQSRHVGRISDEAWDEVASLLP